MDVGYESNTKVGSANCKKKTSLKAAVDPSAFGFNHSQSGLDAQTLPQKYLISHQTKACHIH